MGVTYGQGKDDQFKDSDSEHKLESPDLWVEEWEREWKGTSSPAWLRPRDSENGQVRIAQKLLSFAGLYLGRKGSVLPWS